MAQKDDRDKIRTITPPAGVRAQTARPLAESFDEETPVEGDPVSQINTRAKNAANNSRAAFGAVAELRREVRANNDRDIRDHEVMTTSMDRIMNKVDELGTHVGDIRESMGEVRGKLHILVNELAADRAERAESAKIKAVTEAEIKKAAAVADAEIKKAEAVADAEIKKAEAVAEIDETKEEAKHRRARNLKILGAILTAISVLITMLTKC